MVHYRFGLYQESARIVSSPKIENSKYKRFSLALLTECPKTWDDLPDMYFLQLITELYTANTHLFNLIERVIRNPSGRVQSCRISWIVNIANTSLKHRITFRLYTHSGSLKRILHPISEALDLGTMLSAGSSIEGKQLFITSSTWIIFLSTNCMIILTVFSG